MEEHTVMGVSAVPSAVGAIVRGMVSLKALLPRKIGGGAAYLEPAGYILWAGLILWHCSNTFMQTTRTDRAEHYGRRQLRAEYEDFTISRGVVVAGLVLVLIANSAVLWHVSWLVLCICVLAFVFAIFYEGTFGREQQLVLMAGVILLVLFWPGQQTILSERSINEILSGIFEPWAEWLGVQKGTNKRFQCTVHGCFQRTQAAGFLASGARGTQSPHVLSAVVV
jgi:hypothetical protein